MVCWKGSYSTKIADFSAWISTSMLFDRKSILKLADTKGSLMNSDAYVFPLWKKHLPNLMMQHLYQLLMEKNWTCEGRSLQTRHSLHLSLSLYTYIYIDKVLPSPSVGSSAGEAGAVTQLLWVAVQKSTIEVVIEPRKYSRNLKHSKWSQIHLSSSKHRLAVCTYTYKSLIYTYVHVRTI